MQQIISFKNEYSFLSNFYPCDVIGFKNVESAYQSFKTTDIRKRKYFLDLGYEEAYIAKKASRKLIVRDDWNEVKNNIMLSLLQIKFNIPKLSTMLLSTYPCELIEGNYWNDTYWGQCPIGNGLNMLGKYLMEVRESIKNGILISVDEAICNLKNADLNMKDLFNEN